MMTADDASPVCWNAGWNEDGTPRPGHGNCPEPYNGHWGCCCACHPLSPMNRDSMPRNPSEGERQLIALAGVSARGQAIAEEALNLLDQLDQQPGNRVLILQRARQLREDLGKLVE